MKRCILFALLLIVISASHAGYTAASDDCSGCAGVSADVIAAYPAPNVTRLAVDSNLLYDRMYMQLNAAVNIHDAPGGAVVGHLEAGFNFVTVYSISGDWVEINPGQWVQAQFLSDSSGIVSRFSGVLLPDDALPYPFAWLLVNLYPSKTPGGDPSGDYSLMYRYTMVNLYSSVVVDGYRWYQIGVEQWVHQHNIAKYIPVARPATVDTDKWVSIDLFEQVLVVYQGDKPIFTTLIASGLPRWETQEGTFHIYYRRTRIEMSAGTPGDDLYYLEEVPWTMFFDEGRALHGAYWHDGFGYRRSHGCVNLSITDAKWLYDWVAQDFDSYNSPDVEDGGPAVYVYHSDQYR